MPLRGRGDLVRLDYAYNGQPHDWVAAKAGIALNGLDLAYDAQPFWSVVVGTNALTAAGLVTGAPTVAAATAGQKHPLGGVGLVAGAPTVAAATAGQKHPLGGAGLATGAPTLTAGTFAQIHPLGGAGLATGAPEIATGVARVWSGETPAHRTYVVPAS